VEEEAAVVEESPAVEEAPTGFAVQGIGGGDGGGGPTITTGSGSVKGPIATGRPGRKGGTGAADAADAKPRKIASRPKNMGETGSPPKPIKAPKPKYPKYFAQKAIAGRVVVECIIDQQGRIADCRRKSGHEELAKFLIHFLKNEHMYEPARDADGRPRRYKKVFSQDFKLT
jgi:outer membrane biosynthesis protein TonB